MDPSNPHWEAGFAAGEANQVWRIAELERKLARQPRVPKSELIAAEKRIAFLEAAIAKQSRIIQRFVEEKGPLCSATS